MAQLRVLRTDDFTGGLNLRADPFQLGDNESPDLLNVDIDPRGGMSSRGGMQRWNTTAIGSIAAGTFAPKRIFNWATGSPQLLIAANSKVFYGTGASFTDTTIATTSSDGASFAPWSGTANVVYVACGTGSAQMAKWSGAAKTMLTASGTGQWQDSYATPTGTHMPRADHAATHVDRMWVASTFENSVAYPNRVRFSHPNFPESWRELDYIDIVGGGSGITAMVPFGGALIVFKQNSIHAIYGYDTDTFQVVTLTESIGTPHARAVCATENYLFFFDWPDGVFRYDGKGFTDMFEKIRPLISLGTFNASQLGQLWLGKTNAKLWLSLPTGSASTPTHNYVFDMTVGSWTRYQLADGKAVAAVTDYVESNGNQRYLGLHPTEPFVLQVDRTDTAEDNVTGTAAGFSSYYVTKWHDAGVVSARKMWRRPDFVVKQPTSDTTLSITTYHDWEESVTRRLHQLVIAGGSVSALQWNAVAVSEPDGILGWGDAAWGANATGAQFERGSNLGLARSVQLKIAGPASKPWGVNSISYKYIPRRVR